MAQLTASDTHRHLFNKRVRSLLIAGAFVLLVTLFFAFRTPPIETQSVKVIQPPATRRFRLANPPVFNAEAYYRTIIDNNLFRPLGWTPPHPIEPYRLLGTKLARDANIPPQAIVQVVTTNMTHIVTLGSNLDVDTQVVDIQSKQVTLSTQGQQRTLMLLIGF